MCYRAIFTIPLLIVCAAPGAIAGPLSDQEKQTILAAHNQTRDQTAAGLLPDDGTDGTYPTAADMTQLVWNDTLESIAQGWANGCVFAFNPNRNNEWLALGGDPSLGFLGENLALAAPTSLPVDQLYNSWAQLNTLWHYQPFSGGTTPQFSQLIWSRTTEVGCAAAACTINGFPGRLLVCDYVITGNLPGQLPYQSGAPASACPQDYVPGSGSLCVKSMPAPPPVPDGGDQGGSPMRVSRNGNQIEIIWDVQSCGAAPSYNLYAGSLDDFGLATQAQCGIGTSGSATVDLTGSVWFILSSADGTSVGSFGSVDQQQRTLVGWEGQCAESVQDTSQQCSQ